MSRPGVEAVAELSVQELASFTQDVADITISTTALITHQPIEGRTDRLSVTIRVDKEVDGDLLRASLKDGLLHAWGWDKKFTLRE